MDTSSKTLVLITGANSGVGLGLAAVLLSKPDHHILFTARDPTKGHAALHALQSRNLPGTAEFLQLDVTDDSSIEAAARHVEQAHGRLDLLVNNAGVTGLTLAPLRAAMRTCFDTNATGPAVVTQAFGPLLKKAAAAGGGRTPRIVNISSGAGSIERRLDASAATYRMQGVQYRASKTALNMVTACQFVEYEPFGIKVFAYCPGFVVSNLGLGNTPENGARPAEEVAVGLATILAGERDAEAGKFLHNGGVYPW